MTPAELLEIENIKRARTLGSLLLDSADYTGLADLYTDDARCEFGPYGTWVDRSEFARQFAEAEEPFMTAGPFSNMHVVVNHVVQLTGDTTATGIVYLLDFVTGDMMRPGGNPLFWLGAYDEEYRKVDGGWKISRQSLNFLWPDRALNDGFLDRHAPQAAPVVANGASGQQEVAAADGSGDIELIRQLSARYALGLDRFDMEALLAPYADDAVFDAAPMGLEAYSGKEQLREFFGHNQDVMADQMHLFSNFVVELDGPDDAHGTNYLLQDGHNKDGATVKCFCLNEDTYRRIDGVWRIATRRISPLMPPQLDSY